MEFQIRYSACIIIVSTLAQECCKSLDKLNRNQENQMYTLFKSE